MARNLDVGRFWLPDPITVTLTRPASYSGGAATSAVVDLVQEQPAAEAEADSPMGGSLAGLTRTFRMWLIECLALPPHKGYLITHPDGTVWAIQDVDVLCHGRQFRCHARQRRTP